MIETETRYFPATGDGVPAFALQVTKLVDSYMLWIGVTDRRPEEIERAAESGKLCKDWVCAMPPRFVRLSSIRLESCRTKRLMVFKSHMPASVTVLNRSGADDYASTAAQRLGEFLTQIESCGDLRLMRER